MKTKFNIGGLNMYSSYGELCTEVYDISKPLGYSFGDVEFYTQRLIHSKGKVLEAGCGSGRVLIPLLEAGINVDGLDNSTEILMLEKVGFKDIVISADYKYNQAPTNDHQMLTYEAIK